MRGTGNKILFFLALLCSGPLLSQKDDLGGKVENKPKDAVIKNRWGIMPSLIFYRNNPDVTDNTRPGRGLGLSWHGEFNFKRGARLKFLMGVDYLGQRMTFDSYYFTTTPQIFDKQFDYTHQLWIHQLQFPFLFKQSFGNEDNQLNIFYISGGWAFRALFGSSTKVSDNATGQIVWKGYSDMSVEHNALFDGGGGIMMGGMGLEHKVSTDYKKAIYLEAYYRHNLSRIRYTGNNFSNSVYFRDPALTICLGMEF
ncbi:MAG: outer membrane beta-barrel protein [Bacteroidia bacterium]|nr:outer membrane beta-barrel protein [Bacteroidia bacterium]